MQRKPHTQESLPTRKNLNIHAFGFKSSDINALKKIFQVFSEPQQTNTYHYCENPSDSDVLLVNRDKIRKEQYSTLLSSSRLPVIQMSKKIRSDNAATQMPHSAQRQAWIKLASIGNNALPLCMGSRLMKTLEQVTSESASNQPPQAQEAVADVNIENYSHSKTQTSPSQTTNTINKQTYLVIEQSIYTRKRLTQTLESKDICAYCVDTLELALEQLSLEHHFDCIIMGRTKDRSLKLKNALQDLAAEKGVEIITN